MREGLVVGLIGFAAVAVFYAAFDLLAARGTLYTVDLLGKTVFKGLRDAAVLQLPIRPDPEAIVWYSGLHLLVSLAIGVIVAGLVARAEQRPSQANLVLFVIVAGFVVTIVAVGLLSSAIRPVLPWWSIVVTNALSVVLAGWYLLQRHPGLWRRLMPSAR
jgi:hypothetical protein